MCHAQQWSCLCIAIEVLIDSNLIQRATHASMRNARRENAASPGGPAWRAEKAGKVRKNPAGPPCCTRGTTLVAPASQHAFTCGRTHRAKLCALCIVSLRKTEENDVDTLSDARGRGSHGENGTGESVAVPGFCRDRFEEQARSLCEVLLMLRARGIDQRQTNGFRDHISKPLWR
jgi:hypothetical protein